MAGLGRDDRRALAVLRYSGGPEGLTFTASMDGDRVPWENWAECDWGKARPDALFRLLDDGLAKPRESGEVVVPHGTAAGLAASEVRSLGLPDLADFSLKLISRGTLTSRDGRLEATLIRRGGIPLVNWSREGALLHAGGTSYLVPDPLYTVLQRIDAYNLREDDDPLAAWGRLREVLPEDAEVDAYLKGVKVSFASSFRLHPFLNDEDEPDFDVVPGRTESNDLLDEPTGFVDALPPARAEDFCGHFRTLRRARPQYPAGQGWFVVFSESMTEALRAIKTVQQSPGDARRRFLLRPHATLRDLLPAAVAGEVEDLFYDVGYSARVMGIGLWEPRVLPWVKKPTDPWLPPEELGVRVGDEYVRIEPSDLEDVQQAVGTAIQEGRPTIEYGGQELPATQETLEVLEQLVGERRPTKREPNEEPPGLSPETPHNHVVLQIHGNLDEVDFEATRRPRGPGIRQALPDGLRSHLYAHQVEAVEWLQDHWGRGSPGALLADDMGLGKTLEALTFLAWVRDLMGAGTYPRRPVVVVAPTGLLENWKEEVSRHLDSPGLGHVIEAYGSALRALRTSEGAELRGGSAVLDVETLQSADWVLTTYETWRDYQHSFARVHWAVGVFDEVQKVKNPGALVTEAAKAINADCVIALTGTPVENRLADLWSIVDLVQPGRLGTLKEFSRRYEGPSVAEAAGPLGELKEKVLVEPPPLMKRRLKEDHLEGLPEKTSHWPRVVMPQPQAEAYRKAIELARDGSRGGMLKALGELRSISLHPGTLTSENDEEFIAASARLSATFDILDRVQRANEKALIFLESREMQSALIGLIKRRYALPEHPMVVNGAVSGKLRQRRVNRFQERSDFDVMILSPKAGGVGLTLTGANHVIHVSRWWNPAVEDQCTDRVFRIGQSRAVFVYHPIAVHPEYQDHSFDVTLDRLLQRKRAMSRAVLAPTALSPDDIEELYNSTLQRPAAISLSDIDCFEPIQFEEWVMDQLRRVGYRVERTPRTHDFGADCVAHPPAGAEGPPLLLQCKHTQREEACGPEGVEEVVRARSAYALERPPGLALVTNAGAFSGSARQLAARESVRLVGREELLRVGALLAP